MTPFFVFLSHIFIGMHLIIEFSRLIYRTWCLMMGDNGNVTSFSSSTLRRTLRLESCLNWSEVIPLLSHRKLTLTFLMSDKSGELADQEGTISWQSRKNMIMIAVLLRSGWKIGFSRCWRSGIALISRAMWM